MTIQNARRFILRGVGDSDLRGRLNGASSLSELHQILGDEGLGFSTDQFKGAFLGLLAECQTQEAADHVKEFRSWWEFLCSTLKS